MDPLTPVAVLVSVASNLTWENVPVRSPTVMVSPAAAVTPVSLAWPLPEASVVTVPTVVVVPLSETVTFNVVLAVAPLTVTYNDPADSFNDAVPVAPAASDKVDARVACWAPWSPPHPWPPSESNDDSRERVDMRAA